MWLRLAGSVEVITSGGTGVRWAGGPPPLMLLFLCAWRGRGGVRRRSPRIRMVTSSVPAFVSLRVRSSWPRLLAWRRYIWAVHSMTTGNSLSLPVCLAADSGHRSAVHSITRRRLRLGICHWEWDDPGHPGGTVRCRLDGERQCPQGAIRAVPGWRVRGVRRVRRPGGRAALPCRCCFRARCARPGTSAAALGPGLRGVSSSVPAFLSLGGRSRCPRPSGAFELSRPLDDQLASWPDWAGIVLHPYTAGNSAGKRGRAAQPVALGSRPRSKPAATAAARSLTPSFA
jgi:hypothetical protein